MTPEQFIKLVGFIGDRVHAATSMAGDEDDEIDFDEDDFDDFDEDDE